MRSVNRSFKIRRDCHHNSLDIRVYSIAMFEYMGNVQPVLSVQIDCDVFMVAFFLSISQHLPLPNYETQHHVAHCAKLPKSPDSTYDTLRRRMGLPIAALASAPVRPTTFARRHSAYGCRQRNGPSFSLS
nr:hypothetical protein CFP56_77971 [Quercus suber]